MYKITSNNSLSKTRGKKNDVKPTTIIDLNISDELENSNIQGTSLKEESGTMYNLFINQDDDEGNLSNFTNLIQINAEALGIKSLNNEINDYLNMEINYKIKEVLNVSLFYYLLISKLECQEIYENYKEKNTQI